MRSSLELRETTKEPNSMESSPSLTKQLTSNESILATSTSIDSGKSTSLLPKMRTVGCISDSTINKSGETTPNCFSTPAMGGPKMTTEETPLEITCTSTSSNITENSTIQQDNGNNLKDTSTTPSSDFVPIDDSKVKTRKLSALEQIVRPTTWVSSLSSTSSSFDYSTWKTNPGGKLVYK